MINNKLAARRGKTGQLGVTLVEVIAAIAVGTMVTAGVVGLINDSLDTAKAQQAAHFQAKVAEAAGIYVRKNYQTIAALTTAKAMTMADLTAALQAETVLDPAIANMSTNPYGQSQCLLLRSVGGQPQALLITVGDIAIPAKQAPHIASMTPNGGTLLRTVDVDYPTDKTKWKWAATGAFGNWKFSNTDFAMGTPPASPPACGNWPSPIGLATVVNVQSDGMGSGTADWLYRNDIGNPEANTMRTTLNMGTNPIVGAGDISSSGVISSSMLELGTVGIDWTCYHEGAIARHAKAPTDPLTPTELLICTRTPFPIPPGKPEMSWKRPTDMLYRNYMDDNGEANTMKTTLYMGGKPIVDVGNIISGGMLELGAVTLAIGPDADNTCWREGAIARNAAVPSELLTCRPRVPPGSGKVWTPDIVSSSSLQLGAVGIYGSCEREGAIARNGAVPSELLTCVRNPAGALAWALRVMPGTVVKNFNSMNTASTSKPYTEYTYLTSSGYTVPTGYATCFRLEQDNQNFRGGCVALCNSFDEEAVFGSTMCYDTKVASSEPVTVPVNSSLKSGWRGSCYADTDIDVDNRQVFVNVLCVKK